MNYFNVWEKHVKCSDTKLRFAYILNPGCSVFYWSQLNLNHVGWSLRIAVGSFDWGLWAFCLNFSFKRASKLRNDFKIGRIYFMKGWWKKFKQSRYHRHENTPSILSLLLKISWKRQSETENLGLTDNKTQNWGIWIKLNVRSKKKYEILYFTPLLSNRCFVWCEGSFLTHKLWQEGNSQFWIF